MTIMKIYKLGSAAEYLTGISFALGTLLLVVAILVVGIREEVVIAGLFYVMTAIVINLLYFLVLLICILALKEHFRVYLFKRALLLLINIPIVFIYLWTLSYVFWDDPIF